MSKPLPIQVQKHTSTAGVDYSEIMQGRGNSILINREQALALIRVFIAQYKVEPEELE